MKKAWFGIVLFCLSACMAAPPTEAPAEELALKDGASLFIHPDGTSRMVDAHGKPMRMRGQRCGLMIWVGSALIPPQRFRRYASIKG